MTPVHQTCTMFYVGTKPFNFLLSTLSPKFTNWKMLTMVDSEGLPLYSAAASHQKVSCHHCGQVSCCFVLLIVVSSAALLWSLFIQLQLTRSFLPSLHFFLVVGCCVSLHHTGSSLALVLHAKLFHSSALVFCMKLPQFLPWCSSSSVPASELLSCC